MVNYYTLHNQYDDHLAHVCTELGSDNKWEAYSKEYGCEGDTEEEVLEEIQEYYRADTIKDESGDEI